MKYYLFRIAIILILLPYIGTAQEKISVAGTVIAAINQSPLPGVNITIKGSKQGVQTDFDGNYMIQALPNDVLIFSYIGMSSQEVTVNNRNQINIQLQEDAQQLDDVVITALGIKKSRKSLTYAAQDISAEELVRVKDANPINSLSGKVSGVVINRSASGVGGSVKVTLRGNTSTRNNQPLYVVDGIPLLNNSSIQPTDTFGDVENAGNRDGGDALSLINPDDIESITVLKGASASVLYGSQGSNGVILITTKKGKSGYFKTSFSSSLTVDEAAYIVDFDAQGEQSIDDFYTTGTTAINSISISGGTENAQTYFSYANTFATGVIPTHEIKRHTINVRETAKLFDAKMTMDASILLSTQDIHNKPVSGFYFNPLVGVYGFNAENESLNDYEDFEVFDPSRNLMTQRWYQDTSDIEQNPYWILYRNASEDINQKVLASLSLNYKFNTWLSLQARGSYDQNFYKFQRKAYATTNATLAATRGRYVYNDIEDTQLYGDLILTIDKNISDSFNLTANIGTSIRKSDLGKSIFLDSGVSGNLKVPNVFVLSNFEVGVEGSNPILNETQAARTEVQSLFASTTLGYKEMLYLDLTARNDWSSTVADSFFYPSVGVTGILTELFEMPAFIDYGKIRASYAEVGNGVQSYANNPQSIIGTGQELIVRPTTFPFDELKPEIQTSIEVGTEWKFLNDRFGFDIGLYKTNTKDQYMTVPSGGAPTLNGEDAQFFAINAGDFENKGVEASFFIKPIQTETITWESFFNFATNKNTIKKLDDRLPSDNIPLTPISVNSYALFIREGGSFGDIYGRKLKKNEQGLPIRSGGNFSLADPSESTIAGFDYLGNANPDFNLGWSNTIRYKNVTLDFLVDGRFGGEVMSLTQAQADLNGTTKRTGTINIFDEDLNQVVSIEAKDYYRSIGGRNGFSSEYIYDATNIRLAELSLSYKFKLKDTSFFRSINASFIARNLFFFHKDAPYDPNVSLSTADGLQGVDIYGSPATRSFGLNLGLTF